jgi:chromosomal replication initiation ATPase DnaA
MEVHQEKYYRVKDQRYLGEDEFVEKIEGQKESHEPVYWEIPLGEIAREVMGRMKIPGDRLYSMTRDRLGAYGRGLVAYLARKLVGTRVKEIAQYFRREPMTVSLGVRKIETLLQRDRDLRQRVKVMELTLERKGKRKYFITIA